MPPEGSVVEYGRDEADWRALVDATRDFLLERARLGKVTTYTELNTTISRRTGLRPFDFEDASERAAVGHLLGRVVQEDPGRPSTGLMLSALVNYLDRNDAGPGFYVLATDLGLLPKNASADAKLAFWLTQIRSLHQLYRANT